MYTSTRPRSGSRLAVSWLAVVALVLVSACAQNPAARGPFPGFAQYQGMYVDQLEFVGDLVLPRDSLFSSVRAHAPRCRITFIPRALCIFGMERYRLDLNELYGDVVRLHLYYRDHGYYGSRVIPTVEPIGSGDFVELRFGIAPGDQVVVTELALEGVEGILPPDEQLADLPIEVGGPFRRTAFLSAADSIQADLYRRGYAYAQILRNYSVDTIADVAEVTFQAVPGPVVTVDDIAILGAEQLGHSTIRKQVGLREGEILQRQQLTDSQRSLYQLGIVNYAAVEIAPDSLQADPDSSTATVAVRIVEAPKYLTNAVVGWGQVDCLRTGVRGLDRNFLGGGRTLELSASVSKIGVGAPLDFGLQGSFFCRDLETDLFSDKLSYQVAAEFQQPRLLGTRTQLSTRIHAERRSELLLYLRESVGGQINVSREFGRGLLVGTGLEIQQGSTAATPAIFCVLFNACSEIEQEPLRRDRWTNAATLSASYDRTSSLPRNVRGYRLRANAAWASPALLSDDEYFSLLGEAIGYLSLSPNWVLAGRVQAGGFLAGAEAVREGTLPPERRFYGGGPNSVRGFPINGLGPQTYLMREEDYDRVVNDGNGSLDDVPVQSYPLGGTQVVLGSLELRGPSPVLSQWARLAAFVDVGQVWTEGLDERGTLGLAGGNLVITPGFGLRINTPVGPIRADIAYNPHELREGPLYLATQDSQEQLSDLVFWRPNFRPSQQTLIDRFQLYIAVGQAF